MRAWPAVSIPSVSPSEHGHVRLYDSQSRGLIATPSSDLATMYVCGITPYDATHMGHAATYVAFDLLNRMWRDCGKHVKYVQNITDVDDPLLERAKKLGIDWQELALKEISLFLDDMTALRVIPPDHYIGAVESIPLVVSAITAMQAKNEVYSVDGDLYFNVHADPEYGDRSHFTAAEQRRIFAERGGDPDRSGKRDPLDPLLWLLARPDEPSWPSPFGAGRPGWHIECCAIAQHYLGVSTMDVKGGGSDLIFPHHEMSAAQARVITGEPFARTYVHTGMIGLHGEKMSKSKGNLVFVSQLRMEGIDPMAIRLALMAGHYRADRDWSDELLRDAEERLALWRRALSRMGGPVAGEVIGEVRAALVNDLDTPQALAAIDRWCHQAIAEEWGENGELGEMARAIDALLGVAL